MSMKPALAYEYLMQGKEKYPGQWVEHSLYVGEAAALIAARLPDIDSDLAKSCGYLHDIGRRFGGLKMMHTLAGYRFMMEEGYPEIARICLTHSFAVKDIITAVGEWDCTADDYNFVKDYLENTAYTRYDQLIQLCDSLALPEGFTVLERRLVDVSLRYGLDDQTLRRWRGVIEVKEMFERELGGSVYELLPKLAL